ncbi:MAG: hypothetical protein AAFR47_21525 [Pseudomonadota bacterium]
MLRAVRMFVIVLCLSLSLAFLGQWDNGTSRHAAWQQGPTLRHGGVSTAGHPINEMSLALYESVRDGLRDFTSGGSSMSNGLSALRSRQSSGGGIGAIGTAIQGGGNAFAATLGSGASGHKTVRIRR